MFVIASYVAGYLIFSATIALMAWDRELYGSAISVRFVKSLLIAPFVAPFAAIYAIAMGVSADWGQSRRRRR